MKCGEEQLAKSFKQKVKEETNFLKQGTDEDNMDSFYGRTDSDILYNLTHKPSFSNFMANEKMAKDLHELALQQQIESGLVRASEMVPAEY